MESQTVRKSSQHKSIISQKRKVAENDSQDQDQSLALLLTHAELFPPHQYSIENYYIIIIIIFFFLIFMQMEKPNFFVLKFIRQHRQPPNPDGGWILQNQVRQTRSLGVQLVLSSD